MDSIPRPLRVVGAAAATLLGSFLAATTGAAVFYESLRKREEAKRRNTMLLCGVCNGKGFYGCKLCRGNSTIEWSPLYDPIAINPCLCPTCDGNKYSFSPRCRVQRCLNCLGKGYA